MSFVEITPPILSLTASARHRNRLLRPTRSFINTPRTAAALNAAADQWERGAQHYSTDSSQHWEDAQTFLLAATTADEALARRWS